MQRARVVSAGEALVDLIPDRPGEAEADAGRRRALPGGSPFNVAIGLARLGLDAGYAGRLSTDRFGQLLLQTLIDAGADTSLVQHGPEPTPLAMVERHGNEVTYDFRWVGTADRMFDPAMALPGAFERSGVLHLGSAAFGIEPIGARLLALMERLRGEVFLTFDPNVRRTVVDDWSTYGTRVARAYELADIVKVSDVDLGVLGWRNDAGPPRRRGPTVVTAGARGVTLHRTGRAPIAVEAPVVDVVDTVGAGDASMAALIFGLAEADALSESAMAALSDAAWAEILRVMTTAGAMACERPGADPPTADALHARLSVGP